MAFGKDAVIEVRDVDRYGRLVARVHVDGKDVSLALVHAGLAWHFTRYSRDPTLAEAEQASRLAKRGLWSLANPIAPWEFRRQGPPQSETTGDFRGRSTRGLFLCGLDALDRSASLSFNCLSSVVGGRRVRAAVRRCVGAEVVKNIRLSIVTLWLGAFAVASCSGGEAAIRRRQHPQPPRRRQSQGSRSLPRRDLQRPAKRRSSPRRHPV